MSDFLPNLSPFGRILSRFLRDFSGCALFRGFYEARTAQLKACCKNFKFLRAAYIAAYKIDENSDEMFNFRRNFPDFVRLFLHGEGRFRF